MTIGYKQIHGCIDREGRRVYIKPEVVKIMSIVDLLQLGRLEAMGWQVWLHLPRPLKIQDDTDLTLF